jgi:transcriptional regulator with XRE-family HTH domain
MAKINQARISKMAGVSASMLSMVMNGKKRAGWKTAKKMSGATKTKTILWLEGSPEEIVAAIQAHVDRNEGKKGTGRKRK